MIIGDNRWDFRNGRWEQNAFPGLDVRELLMWHDAKNPRVLRRHEDGVQEPPPSA